jgi:hypothetical protein
LSDLPSALGAFRRIKGGVTQYVVVKLICALAAFVLKPLNAWGEVNPRNLNPNLETLNPTSSNNNPNFETLDPTS